MNSNGRLQNLKTNVRFTLLFLWGLLVGCGDPSNTNDRSESITEPNAPKAGFSGKVTLFNSELINSSELDSIVRSIFDNVLTDMNEKFQYNEAENTYLIERPSVRDGVTWLVEKKSPQINVNFLSLDEPDRLNGFNWRSFVEVKFSAERAYFENEAHYRKTHPLGNFMGSYNFVRPGWTEWVSGGSVCWIFENHKGILIKKAADINGSHREEWGNSPLRDFKKPVLRTPTDPGPSAGREPRG